MGSIDELKIRNDKGHKKLAPLQSAKTFSGSGSSTENSTGNKFKRAVSEPKETKYQPNSGPNPYEESFHSEFCFMALVLGFFGLIIPFFSVLAIIFGIGGLMQTHRERMKGRWMAILGIIMGFAGLILISLAVLIGINFIKTYLQTFNLESFLVNNI